ncbi:MAG: sigma-54 dependent transcriptional regulator [Pseudomonadota bacterium]
MTSSPHILVIDDEPDIRSLLQEILMDEGYSVATAEDAAHAREARLRKKPDLILLDIWMPDVDGITLLKEWIAEEPLAQPVIMMSGHGTVETAVEATRLGAYDYIEKPLSLTKLLLTIENALESYNLQRENLGLRMTTQPVTEPIGRSHQLQHLRRQALRIAQHDTTVLVTGETGSGKQLFARYLHNNSMRRHEPFVTADITPLNTHTNHLVQLFGHEDNKHVHYGLVEQANGGTLYIDDIGELDNESQLRLVQLLRDGTFERQHGATPLNADIRIIAATRHPLDHLVNLERFRTDLYYELNVVSLYIPALREHSDDVLDLIAYYRDYFVESDKLPYRSFNTAALNRLRQYNWPGNVQELKNLVKRMLIVGRDREIDIDEIEEALGQQNLSPAPDSASTAYELPIRQAREQFERSYFEELMRRYEGSVNKVAQHAGMERTHLYRKLRSLRIDPKAFGR